MITSKNKIKVFILTMPFIIFTASEVYSSEKNHDQHIDETLEHGEKKSNEDHGEETGFELSAKAIKLMQIETAPITSKKLNKFKIPISALVSYGEKYGVYKFDGKHFELIDLTNIKKEKLFFISKTDLLKNGDLLVVKGVPLLRVAHLQASGQGGEGHGH